MEELQCPSCGLINNVETSICSCGYTLKLNILEGVQCPNCGFINNAETYRCICGYTFNKVINQQDVIKGNFNVSKLANKKRRFINDIVDIFMILILYAFIIYVLITISKDNNSEPLISNLLSKLTFFIIFILYYTFLEGTSGKTLGKLLTKTTVVTEDGFEPSSKQILTRTLCRLIPFEGFFIFVNKTCLHDDFSQTIVVPDYLLPEIKKSNAKETVKNIDDVKETNIEDIEEEIKKYSKDISEIPNYAEIYFNRGTAYLKAQNYKDAIIDFNKAIELNPQYSEVYYNLSLLYSDINNNKDAINMMKQYLNLIKDDAIAYDNLGYLYIEENEYDLAEDNFKKCIEFDKNNIDAIIGLIIIYYEMKEIEKLMMFLKLAQSIEPILKEGKIGIAELRNKGLSWSENSKSKIEKILELFK